MGTKIWSRAFAVAAIAGLTFAACGAQGPAATTAPTAAGTAAPTAAPVAQRGKGGDLKILYWQAPTILIGHQATGTKDYDAARLMLEPLASFGPDGLPVPNGFAAEIPTPTNGGVSKDFTTVTWKMRSGLKWSDGSPATAEDVAFTFKYQCDKATAAATFSYCTGVKSVEAKGETAVVTYEKTQPFYYQWGVGGGTHILQKKQFEACVGAKAPTCPGNLAPIGTGPYKLKEFKPGDVVLFEINDSYRDANKPFFKTVTFKGGGDAASAARAAFQTGDVDYAWNLQVEASVLKGLSSAGDAKANLVTVYGSSVERILLQRADPSASLGDNRAEPGTKHPYMSDLAVRRSLALAADRATVAKELYGDGLSGKATCNILTAPEPMNSKTSAAFDICKFDLAAANKELDTAGWVKGADGIRAKGGVKLIATYRTTVNAVRQKVQDIMKKDWESIGWKINLESVDAGVFFTNTAPNGANKFFADIEMFTNSGDPDPTSYYTGWTCAQANGKAANWNNGGYERYCNAEFDKIVDSLRSETDQAKRNDLATKANDLLIKDVVIIPLVNRTFATSGVSKTLKGVAPTPWDSEMWNVADWTKYAASVIGWRGG
jgi:peptide/nickel transport system substrate-binding protein